MSMLNWAGMVLFRLGRNIHFASGAIIPESDVVARLQITNEEHDVVSLNECYFERWVLENNLLVRDPNEVGPKEFVWFEQVAGSRKFQVGHVIDYPILDGKLAIKIRTKTRGGELMIQPKSSLVFSTNFYFDHS